MHRNHRVPRAVYRQFLIGLIAAAALAGPALAQPRVPPSEGRLPGVAGPVFVPINGTRSVQMSTRQNLKNVTNTDPNVARVSAMPDDPTRVLITGMRSGTTHLTLVDVKDNKEEFDIVVQTNLENLRTILRQAVPTASLTLIPASENTVVLEGTVLKVEDVDVIMRTAQAVGGYQLVNALRVGGVQQVQLCVVVARVNRSLMREFGFNFLTNSNNTILGSTVGQLIPPLGTIGVPSSQLQPPAFGQILNSAPGAANLFGGVIHPNNGFLGYLQALESEGLAKVLSEPKLITMTGRPASFLDGGEQAVPVPAGLGQVGIQFEEFGTRLNFLPIVLGNGKIHLEVEPEVSALSAANGVTIQGTAVPGRVTQRIHTTVELEDGQTFAIGGLIQKTVLGGTNKVPLLGDIPFLGVAFSTKTYSESDVELVVLVTPRLVDAMDCRQLPKLLPGQETRSPDDFELFLEGILEAPRGPREVFPHGVYVPAYKHSPSAAIFPCAGGYGPHGPGGPGGPGGCGSCGGPGGSCGGCGGGCGCAAPAGGSFGADAVVGQSVVQPASAVLSREEVPADGQEMQTPDDGVPLRPVPAAGPETAAPTSMPATLPASSAAGQGQ